jgi:hypothetical protein
MATLGRESTAGFPRTEISGGAVSMAWSVRG